MTAKGQIDWPPEKLEEWARPALTHPELIEIARTATSNNEAKNKALVRVTETREDLAQACRWLRILRVKSPERFEKLISQTNQNPNHEGKEVEKQNREISILVDGVKTTGHGKYGQLEVNFEFKTPEAVVWAAIEFLDQIKNDQNLVEIMVECVDSTPLIYNNFRMKLIQILEEKFGLKIKICGNCKCYISDVPAICKLKPDEGRSLIKIELYGGQYSFDTCEHWEPKSLKE